MVCKSFSFFIPPNVTLSVNSVGMHSGAATQSHLAKQDLATLDVSKLTPLTPEVAIF